MANTNRWRVRAHNNVGSSGWSSWRTFSVNTVTAPPAQATPLIPANGSTITTTNPTYEWDAAEQASSYYLEVRTANDAIRIWAPYTSAALGCVQAGSRCRISKADAPMSAGNKWRVQSVNALGASNWSDWNAFTAP